MRSHEMIYIFSKSGAYYKRVDIKGDFKKYSYKKKMFYLYHLFNTVALKDVILKAVIISAVHYLLYLILLLHQKADTQQKSLRASTDGS